MGDLGPRGPSERHRRLLQYARHFAVNLSYFIETSEPMFCCPSCLTALPLSALDHVSKWPLEESHIFPKGAGGRRSTLECSACNNRLNAAGDNEIVEVFRLFQAILSREATKHVFTKARVNGQEYDVVAMPGPKGVHFRFIRVEKAEVDKAAIESAIAATSPRDTRVAGK